MVFQPTKLVQPPKPIVNGHQLNKRRMKEWLNGRANATSLLNNKEFAMKQFKSYKN